MKIIAISHLLVCLLGTAALYFYNAPSHAASYFIGSFVLFLSFVLFRLGFGLIFEKKLIALAIGIIVFKYAILGIIIFTVAKLNWFDPLWFCLGVASFLLSAVGYAIYVASREGKNDVI